MVVKALRDVARHLDMLFLIPAHRNPGRLEHQNVRGHQDRITVQRHHDAFIRVLVAAFLVGLYHGFVGVRAVHQSLGCRAGQDPGEVRYLFDI